MSSSPQPAYNFGGNFNSTALPPPPDQPRRRSAWLIVLLVVGICFAALVGLIALIIAAGAFFVWTAEDQPVTEEDRALVVRAEEYVSRVADFDPDLSAESMTKSKYIDGSYEIEYEYEHPDENLPFYLYTSISIEPSVSDATTTYVSMKMGMNIGLAASGESVDQVERNDLFQWGDESRCALITGSGSNVGNFFIARKGKRVFCFMVTGHCCEDRESLSQLLMPHLEKLEAYQP